MWLLLSSILGLGFAQEHVQDVYTTLSGQYDAAILGGIEGMLTVIDEQSGLAGSKVVTRSELKIGRLGNVVSVKGTAFGYKCCRSWIGD